MHNVSLTTVQDLQTGHVISILRGPTWDDISVVGFYQVVQGSDFGRTFIQLITEIPMPPLGIIKHDQMSSVYAINRYGLLNFNILVTKKMPPTLKPSQHQNQQLSNSHQQSQDFSHKVTLHTVSHPSLLLNKKKRQNSSHSNGST